MPILNRIQQRSFSGGLLLAAIYAILSIGAVTMLYPFLLMLSGSMKSELDMHELDVIPRFLYDEQALFQRFEEQRYAKLDAFNSATLYRDEAGRRLYAFDQLPVPIDGQLALVKLWEKFLQAQGRSCLGDGHGTLRVQSYRRGTSIALSKAGATKISGNKAQGYRRACSG